MVIQHHVEEPIMTGSHAKSWAQPAQPAQLCGFTPHFHPLFVGRRLFLDFKYLGALGETSWNIVERPCKDLELLGKSWHCKCNMSVCEHVSTKYIKIYQNIWGLQRSFNFRSKKSPQQYDNLRIIVEYKQLRANLGSSVCLPIRKSEPERLHPPASLETFQVM